MQVGAQRIESSLTPPGAIHLALAGSMESREGLARELMRSPSLLHPAGSLPPLGHAAYTCTCRFRTARPGATPPSCWACLPLGLGEPRVSSTRGGKVNGGSQSILCRPGCLLRCWGTGNRLITTKTGPTVVQGLHRLGRLGQPRGVLALVWVGFDQGDGAEVPVEATCTLHSSGLLGSLLWGVASK